MEGSVQWRRSKHEVEVPRAAPATPRDLYSALLIVVETQLGTAHLRLISKMNILPRSELIIVF